MRRSNSLLPLLHDIRSGKIQNIAILTGAGISVPSGIPDFRSATGLYRTLRPELLTVSSPRIVEAIRRQPTLVVDYELFRSNPFPYLEVRRNLILGVAEKKWKPTLGHALILLFHQHHQLRRLYTQNIDGIDYQLGIADTSSSSDKPGVIINVHGTLHRIECENCHDTSYTLSEFCEAVKTKIKNIYDEDDPVAPKESSKIYCKRCHAPQVKPATVMFGRSYAEEVWIAVEQDFPHSVDLMIVIGTSLQVSPANSLIRRISPETPVLVINNEPVGEEFGLDFGSLSPCQASDDANFMNSTGPSATTTKTLGEATSKDAIILGDIDEACHYLIQQLGWLEEVRLFQDILCPNSKLLLQVKDS